MVLYLNLYLSMNTSADLLEIEKELSSIIRRTGAFIKNEYASFSFSRVEYKSQNDPVSYVDISAEKMLMEGCNQLIPGAGFINEEGGRQESQNGYTWIIDPLDGTNNFTHGIPHFCVSLALSYEDEVIMGFVYGVMLDELFSCIKGQGAKLNGRPIYTSEHEFLKTSVVVTGFPFRHTEWVDRQFDILRLMLKHSHGFRRFGSAALDLAYVACGRVEAFFEFDLKPWDLAAGALLIEEAGGKVTGLTGKNDFLFGGKIIGTNGKIHDEMLGLIREKLQI